MQTPAPKFLVACEEVHPELEIVDNLMRKMIGVECLDNEDQSFADTDHDNDYVLFFFFLFFTNWCKL